MMAQVLESMPPIWEIDGIWGSVPQSQFWLLQSLGYQQMSIILSVSAFQLSK